MRPLPFVAVAAVFAAALAFTAVANSYYVFIMATMALTAIVGIGLNVLLGLTGQVSFGHVGFYAIGAYVVAILTATAKLSFWIALPVAAALATLTGALLALPALRVRGPYLAMVTIAFGFIVEQIAVEWSGVTGGQNGIMGIPQPAPFGVAFGERGVALMAIVLAAVLLYGFWRLARSPWGAAMRAVKDSEVAAESIGLNPVAVKTAAFAVSAACAGLAGGLFASLSGFVTPSTFAFSQSILFVLVVIIGGAGTVTGPLVGAAVVVLLPELLAGLAEYRLLFFGALLLVVLLIAPEGIVGEAARWLGRRREPLAAADAAPAPDDAPAGVALAVEGLTIAFGGVRAVTDFAFDAQPRAITSLIGPNGAGKTTVLNMLGGFYRPDAGTIRLGGEALQGRPAYAIARAGVARTYQTSQLFGSMSVLDNLTIAHTRAAARRAVRGAAGRSDRPGPSARGVRRLPRRSRAPRGRPAARRPPAGRDRARARDRARRAAARRAGGGPVARRQARARDAAAPHRRPRHRGRARRARHVARHGDLGPRRRDRRRRAHRGRPAAGGAAGSRREEGLPRRGGGPPVGASHGRGGARRHAARGRQPLRGLRRGAGAARRRAAGARSARWSRCSARTAPASRR